jgi:hypothetical protein
MKTRIYILAYNDETFEYASNFYKEYEWAKVIRIKTTILFESIMFDEWLLDNYNDWKDFDNIGFLSWKADKKIPINSVNNVIKLLNNNKYDYDIKPLYVLHFDENSWKGNTITYRILNKLFNKLNYPDLYVYNNMFKFYCNYWIAKKDALFEYINFFKKCKQIIDTDEEIQSIIWNDAYYYNITQEELLKIFNKPYYCYHPFIYERIPFLYFHGKKII